MPALGDFSRRVGINIETGGASEAVTLRRSEPMALTDFRCMTRFRVPFCDVDMLQHVNNASYVVWVETVRCIYFAEVLKESLAGANGIILARLELDYEQPLDYREEVAVACRVSRIGRKSFDFESEIWSETRQFRAARVHSAMVAYNYEAKTSIVIPERWRELIAAYEVIAPKVGKVGAALTHPIS
jgi:acyl-CoA thioester hydrolase